LLGLMLAPLGHAELMRWPWYLLVPLLLYAGLVCLLPPLRRSCVWFKWGSFHASTLILTAAILVLSTLALVLHQVLVHPDVSHLAAHLPQTLLGSVLLAGAGFSLLNALMEELIFRGVLWDGIEAQRGWPTALVVSSIAFCLGHANGYPPGALGLVLTSLYGLMLGLLRRKSDGLALPYLAHVGADAAIFVLLTSSAAGLRQ
jgi:membrane protease YdiL (CAAX protease family)